MCTNFKTQKKIASSSILKYAHLKKKKRTNCKESQTLLFLHLTVFIYEKEKEIQSARSPFEIPENTI
jgi:hypothetical protein